MALYALKADGIQYDIRIVSSQSWGGEEEIIIYESPGSNGGIAIVTGRKNNTVELSGTLLATDLQDPMGNLNYIKGQFIKLKNAGIPVVLIAPIDNDDTGVYLIKKFSGNVNAGMVNSLTFTMELFEYRQANIQKNKTNLISFAPSEEFKNILATKQIL